MIDNPGGGLPAFRSGGGCKFRIGRYQDAQPFCLTRGETVDQVVQILDLVIVESIVGEQQLAETDDVVRYEKYLELLREAASTGTEAAAVIRRSLESLR